MTTDARLTTAIKRLVGAGMVRFDVRATLALTLSLGVLALVWTAREVPDALWIGWGAILGWYFPRPQEQPRA